MSQQLSNQSQQRINRKMNMRPPPPPTLSKEYSRVWIGWCMIGDREVAREAAAKGIYIQLALQFIATRKEWDHSDVERWFRTEILSWVYQLVEQKQIFKASHILSNIGIDASEQLSIILSETTSKSMRDYIADHLLKNGNLESHLLNYWKLILAIEKSQKLLINIEDVSQISIQKLMEQRSPEWKNIVAATVFFNCFDFHLETFLTPESSWENLLSHEKLNILKLWINVYFSKDLNFNCPTSLSPEIYQKLKNMFLIWEINSSMINQVKIKPYPNIVKEFILTELSNFGIFTDDEKDDVSQILSRFSKKQNIENMFNILQEPTASFSMSGFYKKFNNFCISNEFFELLNIYPTDYSLIECSNKQLSLWLRKKENDSILTEEIFRKYIVTAINYFSDDVTLYLKNNPIILIALIVFTENTNFYNILINKNDLSFDNITINSENITNILTTLPVFSNILYKFTSQVPENHNLYELIKKESNLSKVFEFRNDFTEIPNFNNKILCEKFGHSENINYLYHIKQNRPGRAAKFFILDQFRRYGNFNESETKGTSDLIYKFSLQNCLESDLSSSNIAFLEMIGGETTNLRIIINCLNKIKEANICSQTEIKELINDLENSSQRILNILEDLLLLEYNAKSSNFIEIIQQYELMINFAKINNLDYPEKFLLHCTEKDLWLEFLIFIQMYNYPLEQCLNLSQNFKNKNFFEHIYHSLSKEIDSSSDNSFSSSVLSTSTNSDLEVENLTEFTLKSNFLKVLINCHKSEDPPTNLLQASRVYRHPVFAILSTCYEPDSVVTNWITWLSISTNIDIKIVENYCVSPQAISNFLEQVLLKKYVRTLLESFEIFLPDNPLLLLAQYLDECVKLNFESSTEYLKQYEKSLNTLKFNTVVLNNDYEFTFLSNSYWLINTSLKLIFATLGTCFESKYHQIKFLDSISTISFDKNIPIEYPDFDKISKLLQCFSSNIIINLSVFLDLEKRREEIVKCIEELVINKKYKDALELAKYEDICKEYVLNEEWSSKFKKPICDFFAECNEAFELANIQPSSAAEFFVYCCMNLTANSEKYKAIKLAYTWLKKSNYSDHFVENIEREIWSNYFALDDSTLKDSCYDKHETNYLLNEIKSKTNTKSKIDYDLNQEQLRHFEETIGKILESGDIIEALRLEKMFNQKCTEIEILETCYKLAEGKLKPYEISTEQRLLFLNRDMNLKSVPHRRRNVKSSRTSTGSYDSVHTIIPLAIDQEDSGQQDTLSLLETLTDRLKHGSNIGSRILMCYRISVNVKQPYQDVVKCVDSEELLKNGLAIDCCNKLEVVHDIFIIFKWTKMQVIDFILEELQKAIRKSINHNLDSVRMWDIDLDSQFHLVLQLCPEGSSTLGKKILNLSCALQSAQINSQTTNITETSIVIELLVRAHDCFNSDCNMEGISSILKKAQTLSSFLLNLKHWKLMVRLLTGIKKYSEMSYIFQILKENDQFEYLLKRNFRQDNGLKMALLNFLKKNCPKNQDLYRIVALHFTLFSEVAGLWESEAEEMIANLIEIAKLEAQNQGKNFGANLILFTNNDSTKLCLNKAMCNYTHASEYHLHGEKLISAMSAAKKAELIALQIGLLKNVLNNCNTECILNLSDNQILQLISSQLSFSQSKILVESYNYQVDWPQVIFKQCILNAKLEYLEEYLTFKPLTVTLVQDLTRRFLAEKIISSSSVKSMKDILRRLDSVQMKYRLASELGFADVIEPLLDGAQLAYLKDTVWKKGYKQL